MFFMFLLSFYVMVFTPLRWAISQCILAVFENFLIENPSPECPSTT